MFTCACVRECVRSCVLVFVSECGYAYFPASERSIVRPFVCTCANSFAMACVSVCACACVRECVRVCVSACVCAWVQV